MSPTPAPPHSLSPAASPRAWPAELASRPTAVSLETTLPDASDFEAFELEVMQLNFRYMQWLVVAGTVVVLIFTVALIAGDMPMAAEAHFFDGLLVAIGLITFFLIQWFRRHPVSRPWPRVMVLTNAALFLGIMTAYYLLLIPAYGNTATYTTAVLSCVLFYRLPPRVLAGLLFVNHAALVALLIAYAPMSSPVMLSTVVDCTGTAALAGLAGWLLYRAQWQNFCKERIITARNRELARLHQLELSEKIAAQLAEEKARLEVLRYQLNPHFLFNALTSVCSQLPPSHNGARAAIERLTDFCQLTLFKPAGDTHPTLGDELKLLRAYLDIEKSRWGDLLTVEFDVVAAVESEEIPSLLLLPLVENALKYGRATSRGAMTIRVVAQRGADSALEIAIANSGEWVNESGTASVPSLGIGLENLRQRLARYYTGRHEFTHEARAGWVVARLRLLPAPPSTLAPSAPPPPHA